ncbi:MAG: TetR/AcrR family transcriptional regulator [Lachnospiraceae bacterium]|nr:TetR/AcrR family transcriptional regulator [Lachnospiraceae bacterium]
MARRIKEDPTIHRKRIAEAAEKLFVSQGIEKTTVSQIADLAGYSKATIYVYFENKEDIISYLVLHSMELIKKEIINGTRDTLSNKDNFINICNSVLKYQKKYPMYFGFLQDTINVDFSESKYYQSEADAYKTGEEINAYLIKLFNLKDDAFAKIFTLWASICGVIQMTDKKAEYIKKQTGLSEEAFIQKEFKQLYSLIKA